MFKSLLKSFQKIFSCITNQKPLVYGFIYLLLIPVFAFLFNWYPGLELEYKIDSSRLFQSFYFSVVTITTLGYGDITPKNYSAQLFAAIESVLGVIIFGLFLNSLSHSLSLLSQKIESKKAQKKRYKDEVTKLKKYNRLIQIDIANYLRYIIPVTTPIKNRAQVSEQVNEEFCFNEMKDLFQPTLFAPDYKPAIEYYFESQIELQTSIKNLIVNVNLGYWSDLENICLRFLEQCHSLQLAKNIINHSKLKSGSKTMAEVGAELIENHQGEVEFLPTAHLINPYVALYFLIKYNLEFLKNYDAITDKIFLENKIENVEL